MAEHGGSRQGKGGITAAPHRRLRVLLSAQIFWLALVCLLGAWWTRLMLDQAARIAELEKATGVSALAAIEQWTRTQRMLFWESATFVLLLILSTAVLFWLYWRDTKRSRGIHAFFASMTHELRTPLTSIRLQAESIAESLASDADQKRLVDRLLEDTMRLESQVERTLELARVEGGGPVFPQSLRLKPWLERLIKSWEEAYQGRVQVRAQIADVAVEADPTAMQVILRNLLENSFRHAKREPLQVTLSAEPIDGKVVLTYRDNGPAYKGDTQNLGELFQKGPASQGAGVGLYLVRVLMSQMGGWVRFTAREGFEVVLGFKSAVESHSEGGSSGR